MTPDPRRVQFADAGTVRQCSRTPQRTGEEKRQIQMSKQREQRHVRGTARSRVPSVEKTLQSKTVDAHTRTRSHACSHEEREIGQARAQASKREHPVASHSRRGKTKTATTQGRSGNEASTEEKMRRRSGMYRSGEGGTAKVPGRSAQRERCNSKQKTERGADRGGGRPVRLLAGTRQQTSAM